jgi:aminopeptidase N
MRILLGLFFLCSAYCSSQNQEAVDFVKIEAEIKPYQNASLSGIARYDFNIKQPLDSLVFDAIDMEFSNIYFKGKNVTLQSKYDRKQLKIGLNLKPGNYSIGFGFETQPKQTVYFIREEKDSTIQQIWTQGQGKYTSHWLPSFDNMNEKLEFDLTVHVPAKYNVIANGKLTSDKVTSNLKSYKFDMINPMSSYLAAFVVGDFDKKVIESASGVPIELYYEPKDSLKFEPTYRYTKKIFDFLEEEIGVAYPWQIYKQVPVQDFLYAGMENTTCTIFSNQYVIDSTAFVDKNYVNVNAHELAHQWFGNFVTEESGNHHWLHEGFATYYAYLVEQHLFGDDHFYWKLYKTAKTLHNLSENGDGEALTNPNANSLTFYEKGAWALVMLKEYLGDDMFKEGIQRYLNKHAYGNVTISDFLSAMEKTSGQDLKAFRNQWLENEEFHWEEASKFLAGKNKSINTFFEFQKIVKDTPKESSALLEKYTNVTTEPFQIALIKNYHSLFDEGLAKQFLKSKNLKVRQAMVVVLDTIAPAYKGAVENLLLDSSYITQEAALFKLWQAFPEDRLKYLDATSTIIGLPNKNVRLTWLTLALVTPQVEPIQKKKYFDELNNYTASQYNFEVRQLALEYLYQIGALNNSSIINAFKATKHHVWQFKKSSRNLVRKIATTDTKRFEAILRTVAIEEQSRIKNIISE